jgi:hypothetical protein
MGRSRAALDSVDPPRGIIARRLRRRRGAGDEAQMSPRAGDAREMTLAGASR